MAIRAMSLHALGFNVAKALFKVDPGDSDQEWSEAATLDPKTLKPYHGGKTPGQDA